MQVGFRLFDVRLTPDHFIQVAASNTFPLISYHVLDHACTMSSAFLLHSYYDSHHALIMHLPRSHCVLSDMINTMPRAPRSHSLCKFSCANICKTMHPARSRVSSNASPSSSHKHKCSLCFKYSLMSLKQNKLQKKFLIHVQVVVETQVMA